jgi:hypothetical protein
LFVITLLEEKNYFIIYFYFFFGSLQIIKLKVNNSLKKMVKLTVELVSKLGPGNNKRRTDETVAHFLNRLTHINFQEKNIDYLVF